MLTRFSPSPTGYLHIGNARAAVINYLYAKQRDGECFLRIDDTDITRCKQEYTDQIITDLKWLGLSFSKMIKQSDRLAIYEKAKDELIAKGRLYPCFETEEELAVKRKSQLSRGVPPIYDRKSLKLSQAEIDSLIAEGKKPYYRFLLNDEEVVWDDRIKGKIAYKARSFSDPVLVRANGSPTYTFCSVVDDAEYGVTDIIRGEDHVTNTAVQIQIFKALDAKIPKFSHLGLLKTKEGEISKRYGGNDLKSLRAGGIDNMTICSYLAAIGSSENVIATTSLDELGKRFALKKFSSGAIFYDELDLLKLNRKLLNKYDYKKITKKLAELNLPKISEEEYQAFCDNIENYHDLAKWQKIITDFEPAEFNAEDQEFLKICAELLLDINEASFLQEWVKNISDKTGRKGKDIYHPIRMALTNMEHGPELKKLIPLLGFEEVQKRLLN